jgi:hypothetical protein
MVEETFVVQARLHAQQADLPMLDGPVAFSFLQNVQTGSYLMSWGGFIFGSRASGGVQFPHSPPFSAEVNLLGPGALTDSSRISPFETFDLYDLCLRFPHLCSFVSHSARATNLLACGQHQVPRCLLDPFSRAPTYTSSTIDSCWYTSSHRLSSLFRSV